MNNPHEIARGDHVMTARVGLLGAGNVGDALITLIDREADAIAERSGVHLAITRVAVRDLGKVRNSSGIEGRITDDALSVVQDPEIDLIVELIGGIEPAQSLIEEALRMGKSVISANKELLATHGAHLHDLAAKAGRDLLYEASVGGAIPLVRALSVSLAGERVNRVMGIVNGTTNYVLTRMAEAHTSYDEALAEAIRLGFAEADPTSDLEGYDAAAKTAIIASIAFNADIPSAAVYRQGITDIDLADIEFAQRRGCAIKLLSIAERNYDGGVESIAVRVHPAMISNDHPLAGVHGSFNAVFVEGDHAGEIMLYGRGAGGQPTASAVLGDLVDAARGLKRVTTFKHPVRRHVPIQPIDELQSTYCITLEVADRSGVMAAVAQVFGEHGVSIRSMEQVGLTSEARMIFITHLARESDVQSTLQGLRKLSAVVRIGGLVRVIGGEDE
jgi:homoserine dehydrogenase